MPSYRGIDQTDIHSSIVQLRDFLAKYSTGPELQAHMRQIDDQALSNVLTAKTDAELRQALYDSKAAGTVSWICELLEFHRVNNTGGQGRMVMDALDKWDARSGARAAVGTPVDSEIDKYLFLRRWLMPLKEVFGGIAPRTEGPLQRYGLIVDDQEFDTIWKSVAKWPRTPDPTSLIDQVSDLLAAFQAKDECTMIGIGRVNNQNAIVFTATRDAAQAIADAFPARTVAHENGQLIQASIKKPSNQISKTTPPNP